MGGVRTGGGVGAGMGRGALGITRAGAAGACCAAMRFCACSASEAMYCRRIPPAGPCI